MELVANRHKFVEVKEKIKLNLKQKSFCELYVSPYKEFFGNATACYMKVYGIKNYQRATSLATQILKNDKITAYIDTLISDQGFNDQAVDKKHNFLIHQYKDFNVSLKAIQEYNKLKKRTDNTLTLIVPKPVMELEDDEVIHKIDKSKAKEMENDTK